MGTCYCLTKSWKTVDANTKASTKTRNKLYCEVLTRGCSTRKLPAWLWSLCTFRPKLHPSKPTYIYCVQRSNSYSFSGHWPNEWSYIYCMVLLFCSEKREIVKWLAIVLLEFPKTTTKNTLFRAREILVIYLINFPLCLLEWKSNSE